MNRQISSLVDLTHALMTKKPHCIIYGHIVFALNLIHSSYLSAFTRVKRAVGVGSGCGLCGSGCGACE